MAVVVRMSLETDGIGIYEDFERDDEFTDRQ